MKIFTEATRMLFQLILSHLGPDITPADVTDSTLPLHFIGGTGRKYITSLTKNNHPLNSQLPS